MLLVKSRQFISRFTKFLDDTEIIASATAFVLGITANNFFRTLTDETVVNVVNTYSGLTGSKLVFGELEINYGLIIVQLINLVAVSVVIYMIIYAADKYLGWT